MRILRYPLEIVDYQQVQPIWPGHVLSVTPSYMKQRIDLWAVANEEKQGNRPAPLLGIWILATGQQFPAELLEYDALFHGTCIMPAVEWHVWSAVVGQAAQTPAPMGEVGSYADILSKVKARHAGRTQR